MSISSIFSERNFPFSARLCREFLYAHLVIYLLHSCVQMCALFYIKFMHWWYNLLVFCDQPTWLVLLIFILLIVCYCVDLISIWWCALLSHLVSLMGSHNRMLKPFVVETWCFICVAMLSTDLGVSHSSTRICFCHVDNSLLPTGGDFFFKKVDSPGLSIIMMHTSVIY